MKLDRDKWFSKIQIFQSEFQTMIEVIDSIKINILHKLILILIPKISNKILKIKLESDEFFSLR